MGRLTSLVLVLAIALMQAVSLAAASDANIGVAILRADSDSRLLMAPGQTIRLAVAVNNLRGAADAPDTTLTLTLADGFSAAHADPPVRQSGKVLSWTLGVLPAGSPPRFVELDLTASPDLAVGAAPEITASVATRASEADLDNNRDVMPIRLVPEAANLVVRSSLDHVPIFDGRETVASILVNNIGVVPAPSSVVTLTLPDHVVFVSADPPPGSVAGGVVTWPLGDIAPYGGTYIDVTFAPDPALDAAPRPRLEFVVEAQTQGADPMPENNRQAFSRQVAEVTADLKLWLSLEPKGDGDYMGRVTYGNFGMADAEPVTLSLRLDHGMTIVEADVAAFEPPRGPDAEGNIEWALGWLRPGEAGVATVTIRVPKGLDKGGVLAAITSPVRDANPANNQAFRPRPR